MAIIYFLGCFQAMSLGLILIIKQRLLWWGNIFLASLMICISLLLGCFATTSFWGNILPSFIYWPIICLPALFGPTIYSYIRSFTQPSYSAVFIKQILLHTLPYLSLLILFSPEIFNTIEKSGVDLDENSIRTKIMFASYVKSLVTLFYLILSFSFISKASIHKLLPSNSLKVFKSFLVVLIVVTVVGSILSILYWTQIYVSLLADYLELATLTLLSYGLSYYVLLTHFKPVSINKSYLQTNLTDSVRKQLCIELKKAMDEDMLYVSDHYSAAYIAGYIGISEQSLSELLTLEFEENFYDFTNRHRFEYFKKLIKSNPNNSLLELSEQAGFKSKSTFNRTIKALSGVTPSQLKKAILNNSDI